MEDQLAQDVASLQTRIHRGASWFYWVAALSLINSVIALYGGNLVFLAGLAIPQIADGLAAHLGFIGPLFSVGTDLVFAFFLCGFGYLASHGSRAALLVGMLLYLVDGVIFVVYGAYAPALFHVFALFQIGLGWTARQQLEKLRTDSPTLSAGEAAAKPS